MNKKILAVLLATLMGATMFAIPVSSECPCEENEIKNNNDIPKEFQIIQGKIMELSDEEKAKTVSLATAVDPISETVLLELSKDGKGLRSDDFWGCVSTCLGMSYATLPYDTLMTIICCVLGVGWVWNPCCHYLIAEFGANSVYCMLDCADLW